MATSTTKTNKPLNPRGNDQSPLAYNRAKLYSGKALDFDGVNDYVDLAGFTLSGSVASFSFYVNADGTGNVYFLDANPNRFVLRFSNNNVALFSGSLVEFGAINANEWTHLVYVLNGTSAKCYANGVQLGTEQTITAIDLSAATDFDLGRWYLGGAFYDGGMANFKTFNTALTAAQVADLYNNPEKVVPTGVDNTALKLWLPMMEGAGTTAYDGSGNGNHGTISGATYVNGVGAPVAQSAVMDWNKGSNLFLYSEDITNAVWGASDATRTANVSTAPDGQTTADKITPDTSNDYHNIRQTASVINGQVYRFSTFLKADGYDYILLNTPTGSSQGNAGPVVNLTNGSVVASLVTDYNASVTDAGNGWYKVEFDYTTSSTSARIDWNVLPTSAIATYSGDGTKGVLVWGSSIRLASSGSTYVPTLSTAQTTPVLLPQGLTTGRDITGVNLFENVRKQGALNLDGNSWAEVHDNASLDVTDAITLEAWIWYLEGDADWAAISKYQAGATAFMMFIYPARRVNLFANGGSRASSNTNVLSNNDWNHVAITYDKANIRIYINGSEDNSAAYTDALTTTAEVLEIGRYYASNAYATDGSKIAQPRIYNRALTAEEVQRNYNAGKNTYTN